MIVSTGINPVKGETMFTEEEQLSILFKSSKRKNSDDFECEDESSDEYAETFEFKDLYYKNQKTKKVVRLFARTWKFGRDPRDKSHMWRITIQPVENTLVIAESPILTDFCEKEKIKDYIKNNPDFSDYVEMSGPPVKVIKRKK